MNSAYHSPPGGAITTQYARLTPGLAGCKPGAHCNRCRAKMMCGYVARPGNLHGIRPINPVRQGLYTLPFFSGLPLPTLPNVPQPGNPRGLGAHRMLMGRVRRRRIRGLGQTTAGVPAGTILQYTASLGDINWAFGTVTSIAQLIALMQEALVAGNWNVSILSSQDTSGFLSVGMALTVQAGGGGFAQAADVKSILDGVLDNLNYPPASSSISVVQTAGAAGVLPAAVTTTTPATTSTVTSWLSANWTYLALGAAGVWIVREFV